MEDPSRKTVWGRFGSPMGTRTAAKGKMRFGRGAGEVAYAAIGPILLSLVILRCTI